MKGSARKVTDKRYPKCSAAGVLRRADSRSGKHGGLVVSTGALYALVGHATYQQYLPMMRHATNAGPTPESCERFLESL